MNQPEKQDFSAEHWDRPPLKFHMGLLHPKHWGVYLFVLILFLISLLPWNWVIGLGRRIGRLLYRFGGERTNVTRKNIQVCFPDLSPEEQEHIVIQSFEHMGIAVLEPALFWFSCSRRLKKYTRLEGWNENVQPFLDQGKGVLVNGVHNVHIEAGARIFLDKKINGLSRSPKIGIMYRPLNQEAVEYISMKMRTRYCEWNHWMPRKKVKALLARMQKGEAGGILQDQDFGRKNSIFVPFFGTLAATVPSTTSFAWQTNAKFVPMEHFLDEETNTFVVIFHPAVDNFPTEDQVADMTRVNAITQAQIERHPGQYLWSHRRFKTRPEGEPVIYPRRKRKNKQ